MTTVLLLFLVFALPTILWYLFRPQRWRRAYQSGFKLVFAPSIGYQIAGFFVVSCFLPLLLYLGYSGVRDVGAYIVAICFVAAGILLFGQEIHMYPSHFEKRFFWRKNKLPWSLVERLLPLPNGQYLLQGNEQRIYFNRHYIDFNRLLEEIIDRATAASQPKESEEQLEDSGPDKPEWLH